jgi:RNA polymerase primary sigma factor
MTQRTERERVLESVDRDQWAEVGESLMEGQHSPTLDQLLNPLAEPEENVDSTAAFLDQLAAVGRSILDDQQDAGSAGIELPGGIADLPEVAFDDLLDVYLAQMAQEPLLTFDEEVALAEQIERGHQARRALKQPGHTSTEYMQLESLVEAGQAARERLSRANTRLVISIAKRYRGYGIPFPDLIQDGNIGLMRAVDRYDPHSGFRFSTYATWWIRQAVTRSLANNGRVIRIPVHTGGRMREMARTAQRLEMVHGRQPTPDEIAAEMGESSHTIRRMMSWSALPLSLEQPVGEEGDLELGELVEDQNTLNPGEVTDVHLLSELLETLLRDLTAREARILRLRYGLQDGQARTLQEVADKFGLSRERVRQIEREALAKLRLAAPRGRLEHFLTTS